MSSTGRTILPSAAARAACSAANSQSQETTRRILPNGTSLVFVLTFAFSCLCMSADNHHILALD